MRWILFIKSLYNAWENVCVMQTNCIFTSAKEVMFSMKFVYSLVVRITQKLLDQFSQNSVKRWHMGQRRND